MKLTNRQFDLLGRVLRGRVYIDDSLSTDDYCDLLKLEKVNYIERKTENPNYSDYLPEQFLDKEFFVASSDGKQAYDLANDERQKEADERARHEEERLTDRENTVKDSEKNHRHDVKIVILSALIAFALACIQSLISSFF